MFSGETGPLDERSNDAFDSVIQITKGLRRPHETTNSSWINRNVKNTQFVYADGEGFSLPAIILEESGSVDP